MMKRRGALKLIGTAAGASLLGVSTVSADEPWPREETNRWYTHTELVENLEAIDDRANYSFELEEIGESLEGRELVVARAGSGETDVFVVTEQHGDEPTGTNAIIQTLDHLASTGSPFAETVREELTVHVLPMQNPDGGMRNQRTNAEGIDPNRQHDFEVGAEDNPSPETQAMIDYVVPLEPEWVADLHTQSGMYYDEKENPGDMFHSSNFWPIADEADGDAVDLSKKMNVAMYDRVDGFANAQLSDYPGGTGTNIARNAYATYGFGSVLNEMTGQVGDRGERMEGQMIRIQRKETEVLLEETADGTLYDRDPDDVEEIPERPTFGEDGDWPWEDTE